NVGEPAPSRAAHRMAQRRRDEPPQAPRALPRAAATLLSLAMLGTAAGCAMSLRARAVPVLLYHRISSDGQKADAQWTPLAVFDEQMRYLAEHGYATMTASEVARFAESGHAPRKAVCLTFDDGWRSQLLAVPILHRYGFKATFLLIPERGIDDPKGEYV